MGAGGSSIFLTRASLPSIPPGPVTLPLPRRLFALALGGLLLTAAPALAQDEDDGLTRCAEPYGTLAVSEPQDEIVEALQRYELQSPTSLIRMLVQKSNCFLVVERGKAMQNIMQERALAASGELQQDANVGGGQMVAADYVLTPNILFSEDDAGGIGGAVGGLLGRRSRRLAAVAGGVKFKEAQTSLLIADTRTGVQVAAAEGKAKKKDFKLGAILVGAGAGVGGGGYTNTNEGKVIAASFLDNYNNIVASLADNPLVTPMSEAGDEPKAGDVFAEGDMLLPKIDNVSLMNAASGGQEIGKLPKEEAVVFLGVEEDGYVLVAGSAGEGWVRKVLVQKQ